MEFAEGGVRVDVFKQIRVQPFRHRLDGDKLIRAVVELVPDCVRITVGRDHT